MNSNQKIVIGIAVALIALSGLFPPYQGEYRAEDEHTKAYIGYWFLFSPPDGYDVYYAIYGHHCSSSDSRDCSSRIVTSRIGVQMVTIIIVAAGLVLVCGGNRRRQSIRSFVGQLNGEPKQIPEGSPNIGPIGISGWLIIPAIGLVLGPIKTAVGMYMGVRILNSIRPGLLNDPRVIAMGIMDITMIMATLIVASYFFEKRKTAVRAIIGLMVASVFANLLQAILKIDVFGEGDSSAFTPMFHAIIYAGIWCTYFTYSERVKNTFVR